MASDVDDEGLGAMSEARGRSTPTMHDVAALAGVSLKTVSNVVNDYPHVRPATRQRVESAIVELGYQLNASARNLRRGRTGVVGLAVPDLAQPYFGELADSLVTAADARGLTVLIEHTAGGSRERELEVLSSPRRSMTDGLLFSPLSLLADDLLTAAPAFPLVLLGERVFGTGLDHVTMANVHGARDATRVLLERGARRIAVVGVTPASAAQVLGSDPQLPALTADPTQPVTTDSASLRLEGFRRALAEAGLAVAPERLLPASWNRSGGAAATDRALAVGTEFDAVLGLNDSVALGALHALQLAGVSVPGQVQVAGFDDTDEGAFATPGLTSVSPGRTEIASTALDLLLARLEGATPPARLVVAAHSVHLRGSTR